MTLRPGQRISPTAIALNFIATDETWIAAGFKQNGLRLMALGQAVMMTFVADPGVIYETKVAAIPPGVVQGQITPEDAADPLQEIASAQNVYPVRLEIPADVPAERTRPGTLAQATVFTDEGNPINVLAKILMWISAWANYIF